MLIAAILQGVAQDLVVAGLSRIGSLAINKALRLQKVENAIRGQASTNEAVRKALSDFETLAATRYSGFTMQLAQFLNELKKSGLITVIAEEAATKRSQPETKDAFLVLHQVVFGEKLGAEALELYHNLRITFDVSINSLVRDPALAFILDSLGKNLDSRLVELEGRIKAVQTTSAPFEDYDLLSGFLQKLAKSQVSRYRRIRIETNSGAKLVDLEKIYIPSKLSYRTEPEIAQELAVLDRDTGVTSDVDSPNGRNLRYKRISYDELQASFNHCVVLGDPGGGKSTLCQYLCYRLAKHYGICCQYVDKSSGRLDFQPARIPMRVVLRNYEAARNKELQLGIFEYLVREILAQIDCTDSEARYALSFGLSLGKVVLAFDGLDEILNTSVRRDFVNIVTSFCEEYPLCPALVTSRVVGYDEASLPDTFEELLLEKFDVPEIREFVVKFLRVVANLKPEEAAKEGQRFLEQTARTAEDLRQNPLMLGLMAFLFANRGDVPANRPEIYKECAVLMFEQWDQKRDIRANTPTGFDLLHLFGEIATKIYGDTELEEGVSWSWLERLNRQYFRGLFESAAKSNDAASKIAAFLTGRSWVLSEFGPDVYRFTHRTFLEYFFARHLNENHETVNELLDILLPHIVAGEWDVICHLALQIKTFRNQRRTSQAIARLTDQTKCNSGTVETRLAIGRFGASALQYLLGSETDLRRFLEEAYTVSLEAAQAGQFENAASTLAACVACIPDRREFALATLSRLLSSTILSTTDARFDFSCAVATIAASKVARMGLEKTNWFFPTHLGASVKKSVKGAIRTLAEDDPYCAKIFWEWYGEQFRALFQIHNFKMLFEERRPRAIIGSPVDPGIFAMSSAKHDEFEGWVQTMRTIGRFGKLDIISRSTTDGFRKVFTRPGLWLRHLSKFEGDADALRGVLLCLFMHVKAGSDGFRKRSPSILMASSREEAQFIKAFDRAVAKLPREQQEKVTFWNDIKKLDFSVLPLSRRASAKVKRPVH